MQTLLTHHIHTLIINKIIRKYPIQKKKKERKGKRRKCLLFKMRPELVYEARTLSLLQPFEQKDGVRE